MKDVTQVKESSNPEFVWGCSEGLYPSDPLKQTKKMVAHMLQHKSIYLTSSQNHVSL